jgi:hypothetical protein
MENNLSFRFLFAAQPTPPTRRVEAVGQQRARGAIRPLPHEKAADRRLSVRTRREEATSEKVQRLTLPVLGSGRNHGAFSPKPGYSSSSKFSAKIGRWTNAAMKGGT